MVAFTLSMLAGRWESIYRKTSRKGSNHSNEHVKSSSSPIRSLYLEGKVCLEMSQQKRKMNVKSNEAVAWMGNYFDINITISSSTSYHIYREWL